MTLVTCPRCRGEKKRKDTLLGFPVVVTCELCRGVGELDLRKVVMPHDKSGKALQPGDLITMPFIVKDISQSEEACNVSLEAVGPESEYRPSVACNSKLVTKQES